MSNTWGNQGAPSAPDATTGEPRAFEVVLDHIESQILDGSIGVGDRLPPERDLALQLGVSRPAIREAIRTLEAQGVLASRVGSGAQAGTHVINERSQAMGRLLRLQLALAQFPLSEVMEARVALECASIDLATSREHGLAAAELETLLEAMEAATEPEAFNEIDTQFHVTIARLADNRLMGDLTAAVRESLRLPILEAERTMGDWETLRRELIADHTAIARAIIDGDAATATARMRTHITNTFSRMKQHLESRNRRPE